MYIPRITPRWTLCSTLGPPLESSNRLKHWQVQSTPEPLLGHKVFEDSESKIVFVDYRNLRAHSGVRKN